MYVLTVSNICCASTIHAIVGTVTRIVKGHYSGTEMDAAVQFVRVLVPKLLTHAKNQLKAVIKPLDMKVDGCELEMSDLCVTAKNSNPLNEKSPR